MIELLNISKYFPGTKALDDVSLTLNEFEILGLVGENGAGKSTLVRIINGIYFKDHGTIKISGQEVEMMTPYEARMIHKIAYVSQESELCPDLTVAENITLGNSGNWRKKNLFINWKAMNNFSKVLFKELDLNINSDDLVRKLKPADKQLVEIARAFSTKSKIILLDEPTSWLSEVDKKFLFDKLRLLKKKGVGIIFISHFINEILSLCDKVQVLKDGKNIGTFNTEELTKEELITKMLGQKSKKETKFSKKLSDKIFGNVVLKVDNITKANLVNNISFELREGEILGIVGLLGSGKTELAKVIFGLMKPDSGEVWINGNKQKWKTLKNSIDMGLGFITEDRKKEGIIPDLSIAKNITLANFKLIESINNIINLSKEMKISDNMIEVMNISPKNSYIKISTLSGGNQQKVIIARWVLANSNILIMDEPTRGIDVGAKYEIYNLLKEQCEHKKAIIFISSELNEILNIPHRFLVIKKGKIIREFKNGEIENEHDLLSIISS